MIPTGATQQDMQFVLLINACIPALIASIVLYVSGFDYITKITQVRKDRADALAKAVQEPAIAQSLSSRASAGALAF